MDEKQLKSILLAERAAALGDGSSSSAASDLAKQRTQAMQFYQGDLSDVLPSLDGRSSAVTTDVADTVDGIMPSIMDIFMSSEEVVRFAPRDKDDEAAAKQETEYVNYVFMQENPGFVILHSMAKDALIQKNGICKFWWEEGEDKTRETYQAIDDVAFALLSEDESVEIIEHTVHEMPAPVVPAALPAPMPQPERMLGNAPPEQVAEAMQAMRAPAPPAEVEDEAPTQTGTLHDVVVIRKKPYGCVRIVPVPPEEFILAKDARNIRDSRYCAHRVRKSRSDLIAQGYPKAQIMALPNDVGGAANQEQQARATVQDNDEATADANTAMQLIDVTEHYIRVDWNEDGIAELRKVTTAGGADEILDNEEYDTMPFAGITPILMSHRFWGRSLADIVQDIQKIKTALLRAALDNAYFINNGRTEVAETHQSDHTIDDLLTNRPGGIVRTRMPGGLNPIVTAPIAGQIFPLIEYMDQTRETRTGIQRNAVGPDANTINPLAGTATGANMLMTAAQQRIRLIARTFSETGIKDIFLGVHELILKHGKDARQVQLGDEWVEINPREWKTRKDMTVTVGLGTGSRDMQANQLRMLMAVQTQALQMQQGPAVKGVKPGIVTLENVYNTATALVEAMGFRSADAFFTAPDQTDEQLLRQPPPPDPKTVEAQGRLQIKQAEMAGNQQMQTQKMQADAVAKQQDAAFDAQLAKYKADLDARVKVYEANLDAQVKERIGRLEAMVAMAKPDTNIRPGGNPGR